MPYYKVLVEGMLQKVVVVEADSEVDAEEEACLLLDAGILELDAHKDCECFDIEVLGEKDD